MTTCSTTASLRDSAEYDLRAKLNSLLLVLHDLRKEHQPIPPTLETAIRELRQAHGLEQVSPQPV